MTRLLAVTMALGAVFFAIHLHEYSQDFADHLVPGIRFAFEGPNAGGVELFFFLYYVATLLHLAHLTIGIVVLGVIAALNHRGASTRILHAGRDRRPVLAFRRYRVDLPLSALLPGGKDMSAHPEHIASRRSLVVVWLALMALLALTAGSALVHLGWLNVTINLAISVAKTLLVAAFYMHLRNREPWLRVVAATGVVWLAMLIGLGLADYLTRVELPSPW